MAETPIAVIMTTFNRMTVTIEALDALHHAAAQAGIEPIVFLADAGTDGTGNAVKCLYPKSEVQQVGSDIYWTRGMALALAWALAETRINFFLWLNDDTTVYPAAIEKLFETFERHEKEDGTDQIVVGRIQSPTTGELTYGSFVRAGILSLRFELIPTDDGISLADTFNGNLVLVTRDVIARVGSLDTSFSHSYGDLDYGLRASRLGVAIHSAPGVIGACERNSIVDTWQDSKLSIRRRVRLIGQPKGRPVREHLHFVRTHGGSLWPVMLARPYAGVILSSIRQKIGTVKICNAETLRWPGIRSGGDCARKRPEKVQ